jgi:hypothetical protein
MPVKAATGLAKKERFVQFFPDYLRRFDHKRPHALSTDPPMGLLTGQVPKSRRGCDLESTAA